MNQLSKDKMYVMNKIIINNPRDLRPLQVYPDKAHMSFKSVVYDKFNFINKKTKIAAMGSCFAYYVRRWLAANNYSILTTMKTWNKPTDWNEVYNTFCMKQIFDWSFTNLFQPKEKYWKVGKGYVDPYRRMGKASAYFPSPAEAVAAFNKHRKWARKILSTCDVLILTLGGTEIWYSADEGYVYNKLPHAKAYIPEKHLFTNTSYAQNYENLSYIQAMLDAYNPKCKIIVTVSPVPWQATFRADVSAVSASLYQKSLLLCVAQDWCRNTYNAYYFPSYEYVTQIADNPYVHDARHIKPEVVEKVMSIFRKMFLAKEK